MEWILPVALVISAALAVRWQFRDRGQRPLAQIIRLEHRVDRDHRSAA